MSTVGQRIPGLTTGATFTEWRVRLGTPTRDPLDRFAEKVALNDHGCLEWTGARAHNGYAKFFVGKQDGRSVLVYAHRWIWEYEHGRPIPSGLEIDHLCNVRWCVNVEHMELVTHRENHVRRVERASVR